MKQTRRERRGKGAKIRKTRAAAVPVWQPAAALALLAMPLGAQAQVAVPKGAYQPYNPANYATTPAGPGARYTIPLSLLHPTQMNVGSFEIDKKAANLSAPDGKDGGTPALLSTPICSTRSSRW